ncbi:MAG: PLP-dependent aminotransferase family protein [Rhizobiaceae bacterium]
MLPEHSPLPLRAQICEMIGSAISVGSIGSGQPLPSCRDLSRQLGVSRNTVFTSYQQLMEMGMIISRDRSGYFVNPNFVSSFVEDRISPFQEKLAASSRLPPVGQRPSELRKIEHPLDWDQFPYPFVYNQIDPNKFPIQSWRECMRLALNKRRLPVWSGDSDGADSTALVEQLRKRLLSYRGLRVNSDEILITAGAQNALFIIGLLFRDTCGTVGIEDPGYPEARNAFQLSGNRITGVTVDSDGLDPDAIPEECGVIYTTPSHQFPTGVTMPLERRKQLLEVAQTHQMVIVEDDYEAEMNYVRDTLPPIRALDNVGSVVYVGSLSKTVSPGLRLGFMVAHPDIIREAKALRRAMLRHPPTILQDAMAHFIGLGHYDANLRSLHRRYQSRWRAMKDAISRHMPSVQMTPANGGTCFWIDATPSVDTRGLEARLKTKGVLYDNGPVFYMEPKMGNGKLRLGFASMPLKSIEPGIKAIGEELGKQG